MWVWIFCVSFHRISYTKHSIFKWWKLSIFECVCPVLTLVLPFKRKFLSILLLISKFQYLLPRWYGTSTIWNDCFHFHRISILVVDHWRVDYVDSILVQCDATLWHGYSIKSDYYYTRINSIQSNNHAIQWNIWLNTSIYVIAII